MSFDVAADAYDAFMGRWSRQLSAGLADLAEVEPGAHVLDVGCGTGALTADLVRRVGAAHVSAVDPSASFVAAIADRYPGVDVHEGSAAELPFADATFDRAIAQLVVHFMPDPVAGIREMARVTKPAGFVAACVWDYAGDRGPLGVFWEAARALDPDAPGESDLPGTRAGQLHAIFTDAGLTDIVDTELTARIDHADVAEWWAPFTKGAGPAGAYVASLTPDDRARLEAECRRRLGDGPVIVEAVAFATRGRVPEERL